MSHSIKSCGDTVGTCDLRIWKGRMMPNTQYGCTDDSSQDKTTNTVPIHHERILREYERNPAQTMRTNNHAMVQNTGR